MAAAEAPLQRGSYCPSKPTDLRSPCPVINSLANHGYIPRDGRDIRLDELMTALTEVGISLPLRAMLSNAIFNEYRGDAKAQQQRPQPSFFSKLWLLFTNPWALFFAPFGMRRGDQRDAAGRRCVNLDQFSLHNVVEHDISLSRRDYAQGDNHTPQPDLIQEMLDSSSDGTSLTLEDLAALRARRIQQQKLDNPALSYGPFQHRAGAAEIALILKAFGDGSKIPNSYVEALFKEERLPVREGWTKRPWWRTVGLIEMGICAGKIRRLIGITVS